MKMSITPDISQIESHGKDILKSQPVYIALIYHIGDNLQTDAFIAYPDDYKVHENGQTFKFKHVVKKAWTLEVPIEVTLSFKEALKAIITYLWGFLETRYPDNEIEPEHVDVNIIFSKQTLYELIERWK